MSTPLGWVVALSIAVQDVVEGFAVSAPLAFYGMSLRKGVALGVFSGAVEFLAAIAAFFVLSAVAPLVPAALAFSSGCMAAVTFKELLPDAVEKAGMVDSGIAFLAGLSVAVGIGLLLGF